MKDGTFGKFGNYFLLDRLASGGMAEIFIARPAVASANGRILILKRILPEATLDPEYISMFESEIQVTMGFNHANLVQIYDFGKYDGKHFIAMEYIEGKNLRELTNKFIKMGQKLPIPASVNIVAQTAAGLQFAHEYKNHVTGESLNIVHRDVSPQNILVSYEGSVKIIDFGIAKSQSAHSEKTRVGCVKGKLSYLSPEQLFQQELDGRSDIFSLGAVLWELLTGQKLFHLGGQNDVQIIDSIANCEKIITPPSIFNREVSPALDKIVLRALAKNRDDRYETAEEFQKALNDYLQQEVLTYCNRNLGQTLKEVFHHELEEERRTIKKLNHEAQDSLQNSEHSAQAQAAAGDAGHSIPKMAALQYKTYSNGSSPDVVAYHPSEPHSMPPIQHAPLANSQGTHLNVHAHSGSAHPVHHSTSMNATAMNVTAMNAGAHPHGVHAHAAHSTSTHSAVPHLPSHAPVHHAPMAVGTYPGTVMQAASPESTSMLPQKVREQFYIKLTFGRALGLLFYAATLLVLRVDHDQSMLNFIFGRWNEPTAHFSTKYIPNANGDETEDAAIIEEPNLVPAPEVAVAEGETSNPQSAELTPVQPVVAQTAPKRSLTRSQAVARSPAVKLSRSVLLRIRLVLKSGPGATAILVNQHKLNLKSPMIQVPANQKFLVQVQRKGVQPLVKSVQLKPELLGSASNYDLNLFLY